MGYSIIRAPTEDTFCAISKHPKGMENFARPTRGDSMKGTYTEALDLAMSTIQNPTGLQVPDAIKNALDYLIVTEPLREILEAHASGPAEFLPFRLINHKGRPVPGRIFVVNVLGRLSCADAARSEGDASPFEMDEGALFDCKRLALDERKVPPDAKVFRTTLFPPAIFVRDDVREAIEAKGMRVRFVAPGDPL